MGLMDMITGAAERHPEVNQEQHATLLQTAMQMFGNQQGISGLLNNARSQGIGHLVESWVSTGANQPVAPSQLENLIGADRLNQLASRVGVSPDVVRAALSRILPLIVDRSTPEGKLPQAA